MISRLPSQPTEPQFSTRHNYDMTDMPLPKIAVTVRGLERAVIGLSPCPFDKAPHVKGQIHDAESEAQGYEVLRGCAGRAQAPLRQGCRRAAGCFESPGRTVQKIGRNGTTIQKQLGGVRYE